MLNEPDVGCPGKVRWITGAAQYEASAGATPGGLHEQQLQFGLPVPRIRSKIRKVGTQAGVNRYGPVHERIDMTIQGSGSPRAQPLFDSRQGSATGIAEHEIEIPQPRSREILHTLSGFQTGKCHGSVEVVEHMQRPGRGIENQTCGGVCVRTIRGDECDVGLQDMTPRPSSDRGPVAVKHELRAGKRGEIAMGRVVRCISLEKNHVVSAPRQGGNEPAPQGRVPIAPGGAERQSEDDQLHTRGTSKARSRGCAAAWSRNPWRAWPVCSRWMLSLQRESTLTSCARTISAAVSGGSSVWRTRTLWAWLMQRWHAHGANGTSQFAVMGGLPRPSSRALSSRGSSRAACRCGRQMPQDSSGCNAH